MNRTKVGSILNFQGAIKAADAVIGCSRLHPYSEEKIACDSDPENLKTAADAERAATAK